MENKKVLFVATVVKTHIMEFHIPYLQMFKNMGWSTSVAARNDYEIPTDCSIPFCDTYYDIQFDRNPLKPANIRAYRTLKKIIDEDQYDIIHCHTPVGGALARLAARKARKNGTKIIYTAHGFHFYKGAPIQNWLLYYTAEKALAPMTDILITINKEDYERAKTFNVARVEYVPGVGVDTSRFKCDKAVRSKKREELGIGEACFVLLSVGELIARKNHAVVLDALAEIKKRDGLDNICYLICGRGKLEDELKARAERLGVEDHVKFLGYRNDVAELYNCSDLFLFMSIQEGLPVALMEAMASGVPVICSNIRGNTDLVENNKNGVIAENTADAVANEICLLRDDSDMREQLASNAVGSIRNYDLRYVEKRMKDIYFAK